MNCKAPNKIILIGTDGNAGGSTGANGGGSKKWISGFTKPDLQNKNFYCLVPCKKCWSCKKAYGFNWGIRNYLEAKDSTNNYFITFTYDNENLPINDNGYATINYSDMQKFFKRLRKDKKNKNIRYFGCSEYGGKTYRPHYHFNIFGLKLNDLKVYKKSGEYTLYNSEYLSKKWGKGHVVIGELDLATTFYICNYQLKKVKRDKEFMIENNIASESSYMSKNPSIGLSYIYKNIDKLLQNKPIPIAFKNETITIPLPNVYKRHFIDKYTNASNRLEELLQKAKKTNTDIKKIKKYKKIIKETKALYFHLKEQKHLDVISSMYDLSLNKKDFLKTAETVNRLIEKKTKIFKEIL